MEQPKMPVLFLGHGSPMNALEDTTFSEEWKALGSQFNTPRAILAISAHYAREENAINNAKNPKQIYDMYGFPKELYAIKYTPEGDPALAKEIAGMIGGKLDPSFGIDHGIWSILRRMYPLANVPVVSMAVNLDLTPQAMFDLGKKLAPLRQEGVLIFGTGSLVHNLGLVDWDMVGGYPWAQRFQARLNAAIKARDYASPIHYEKDPDAYRAFTTFEHYAPLLYVLGAVSPDDNVEIVNDEETLGSISMTGYLFRQRKA
jgi:4,5-DOPA dioxygenase extradiol